MKWRLHIQRSQHHREGSIGLCSGLGQREQQILATVAGDLPAVSLRGSRVDLVGGVQRVASLARAIGSRRIDLIRDRLVEIELRDEVVRQRGARIETDAEVDVNGAAAVPTWVDRGEADVAGGVGGLITPQKVLTDRVVGSHTRVQARCVAVPDIDLGSADHGSRRTIEF